MYPILSSSVYLSIESARWEFPFRRAFSVQQGIAIPAFNNTLGAILVGGLLSMALWGVTCSQTFTFFTRNPRDSSLFKALIAFLWMLDTFDSVLNCHILYFYLVSNYLNPLAITRPIWSVMIHVAITSISDFLIRSMFAQRFYRLSKGNLIITTWIMAVSTLDLVCGFVITAKAFGISSYAELDELSTWFYINFASGTASDFSVALSLSWMFVRSRTGFRRTDDLVNTLMTYTVYTGLIVGIDAALGMIFYTVMPSNFIFLAFYLLLSKLYLNSYLAVLNARDGLRKDTDEPLSIHLSQIASVHRSENHISTQLAQSQLKKESRLHAVAISVNTLVEKDDYTLDSPSTPGLAC
ncbi:hypothetical protein E4T56_gene6370 [Termitomyces sp. T112]|nr:hypothetical protein E4T56_gene6370 [Termitomyces sp. T112]KAH0579310.1 hypothetical protein H2248_003455 [Termitomyces sp. 'cryptogamus']